VAELGIQTLEEPDELGSAVAQRLTVGIGVFNVRWGELNTLIHETSHS
jgi:hypothetical protein